MGFFRDIFIRIDAIVYGILEQIFQLIINLANFDLFSAGVLDEFAKRMYLILGLVMVFKLIISFIQILIDPDKLSDKESGVANILKRVVISMILIVLVPSIFSFAKQLQNRLIILIPQVVLGIPLDVDDSQISYNATTTDPIAKLEDEQGNVLTRTGKLMAYYSFLPFFYYNSGCEGLGTLNGTTAPDKSMNVEIYSVSDAVPHVNDKDGACSSTEDGYNYNYRYIISTLVGAYMVYVLVFVALKIAIRAIKFGLCQLIAPIPIASYIDPKSSKKAFDNWVSTSVKVYLDLFMRLIVVYFVIFVFRLLFDNEKFFEALGKYGAFQGLLVALLIIVGLLNFAKEMPKFVSGMLGVSDGFSDIGDMFKGAGGMLAAGIGSRVAAAGNFINGMRGEGTIGQRLRRATGSAIAGRISGAYHGRMGALRGKGFKDSWNISTQGTWQRRQNRVVNKTSGSTPIGRAKVAIKDYLQFADAVSLAEGTLQTLNTTHSNHGKTKASTFKVMKKNASAVGFNAGSSILKELEMVLNDNAASAITNANLEKYFDKTTKKVDVTKLSNISLQDMYDIAAESGQAGLGALSRFKEDEQIGLKANKEIYGDIMAERAGVGSVAWRGVAVGNKNEQAKIRDHQDIVNDYNTNVAFIKQHASDLLGIDYKGNKLDSIEKLIRTYEVDPDGFDTAVQNQISILQQKIATNPDAVNRAATSRLKSQNSKEK